jgi:hypothetical protein
MKKIEPQYSQNQICSLVVDKKKTRDINKQLSKINYIIKHEQTMKDFKYKDGVGASEIVFLTEYCGDQIKVVNLV